MRSYPILACLLVLAPSLMAQEAPRPLSLEEAERIAHESNPRFRQAKNQLVPARAGERQRWAAFLPELRLILNSGGFLSRKFTGLDPYGKPVRRDDPVDYTGSSSSQSLSLGLPLFDGGARFRELRAEQARGDATEAAVLSEASVLGAELARRYRDAQRRAELIRVEEALLEAARARRTATERLLRIASASPVDLLGAEIEVADQERALEQARGEARKALLALAEEMGVPAAGWELTSAAPPVFDPGALSADSLAARAAAASPRIAQARAQARAAEHQRGAAAGARWPSVSAWAGFGRSIGREGYDALFEPNPLDQSLSFGLTVSLPVFTQLQTSYRIAQAQASALNAGEDARAARLAIEREVRSALIDLENAHRGARLAEQRGELAGKRLELANQQFRMGALKFVELQTIIQQAAQAERDAVNARFDFAAALATLEEKVGERLLPPP